MLYDIQERQILNQYPNTLANDLLKIDIAAKKLRRECSKSRIAKSIVHVLDKIVMYVNRLIKKIIKSIGFI